MTHESPDHSRGSILPGIVIVALVAALCIGLWAWVEFGSTESTETCEVEGEPRSVTSRRSISVKMKTSCGDLFVDSSERFSVSRQVDVGESYDFVISNSPFGAKRVVDILP